MKVTVTKNLNVRVGKPSVNAPCHRFLVPGSEIDVDGLLYQGDVFDGVDTWMKDVGDNYYWSGGIEKTKKGSPQPVIKPSNLKFNYNELLPIPDQFKKTKGEGILVAIVDTGCHRHEALGDSVVASFDVFTKRTDQRDESTNGHGTFLAGLIAAKEDTKNQIIGVAPGVELMIVKVVKDDSVFSSHVLDGLKWITTQKRLPDIINLSVDFDPGANAKDLQDIFDVFLNKGTILVGAGQNHSLIYSSSIFYPANTDSILGVGCIGKDDIQTTPPHTQINFIVPDLNFLSVRNFGNGYSNLRGCSMSAAIVSGTLALIRSRQKKNNDTTNPVEILNNTLETLTATNFDETLKIFKR